MEILKKKKMRKRREELHKLIRLQEIDEHYYESLIGICYDDDEKLKHVESQKEKNREEWSNKINIIREKL